MLTWITDFIRSLNRHSEDPQTYRQPLSAETGEPVCGSWVDAPITGDRLHCTYPPGHGRLIDNDGKVWDHGLRGIERPKWIVEENLGLARVDEGRV